MRVGLCVLLVILGVVLPAMSQRPPPPAYADSWAVEVSGGKAKAQELAAKHGFVFRGQVGNLKDIYHFELPGNGGEHSPHKTQALEAEEMVKYVEQQVHRQMSKKKHY